MVRYLFYTIRDLTYQSSLVDYTYIVELCKGIGCGGHHAVCMCMCVLEEIDLTKRVAKILRSLNNPCFPVSCNRE